MENNKVITGIFINSEKKEISVINLENNIRAVCPLIHCDKPLEFRLDGHVLFLDKDSLVYNKEKKYHFRIYELQFAGNGLILGKIKGGDYINVSKSIDWVTERVTFYQQ
ncbi:hypothetical protein IM792_02715 [Mucilaginibacter sp. JRF]|uniref:hypothetical protein n=1 Tax=Mucilaginibacter sp. JRF TaxID=2780088 RepID=UPI0018801918|nr:hypothetical protein [Mucilaginibacter sp. JRF]MBE9583349.1 hypothetical protein [Mucilaginibacter sp. JRF]